MDYYLLGPWAGEHTANITWKFSPVGSNPGLVIESVLFLDSFLRGWRRKNILGPDVLPPYLFPSLPHLLRKRQGFRN